MNTKKLKLTTLSEAILKNKEFQAVRGGQLCTCSCFWQGTEEGASIEDNTNANYKEGGRSQHGCNQYMLWDGKFIYWPGTEKVAEK